MLWRYPSLRNYFAEFIQLSFAVKSGTEPLRNAINLVRQLDAGILKKIPDNAPTAFIPKELRRSYKDKDGNIKRNAWELGLAIAMKDALRSGDLYVPHSRQHVSFWNLMLDQHHWQNNREVSYEELQQPYQDDVKSALILQFHQTVGKAE